MYSYTFSPCLCFYWETIEMKMDHNRLIIYVISFSDSFWETTYDTSSIWPPARDLHAELKNWSPIQLSFPKQIISKPRYQHPTWHYRLLRLSSRYNFEQDIRQLSDKCGSCSCNINWTIWTIDANLPALCAATLSHT